jgi:hypothetical protein
MRIVRNLLYADIPLMSGRVYSITCLRSLAIEINKSRKNGLAHTAVSTKEGFELSRKQTYKILNVAIERNVLLADIDIFDTTEGKYLYHNIDHFVFRPFATYFEGVKSCFTIKDYYGSCAMEKDCDEYNSFKVMWLEFLAANETKSNREPISIIQ